MCTVIDKEKLRKAICSGFSSQVIDLSPEPIDGQTVSIYLVKRVTVKRKVGPRRMQSFNVLKEIRLGEE